MIRFVKKTRLRLFLLLLIPIVIIILIFYSAIYTSNELKFSNFIDFNNDNNYRFVKTNDNKDSVDLSLDSKQFTFNKLKEKNSIFRFPFSEYNNNNNDNNNQLICDKLDLNQSIDINTIDGYQSLEFRPQYKTYWNYTFEKKYLETKNNWERLPLKVIILPHSHNDPGWLKTFEQYYFGYTAYILNNMVEKLNQYKDMSFIWAEMSFMSRWWDSLKTRPEMRDSVRNLIKNGQLEIVTGGWVMTDEAAAHYYDMIDQLIEGHQFLKSSIGLTESPVSGWSIDPFGHGSTLPYLLQKAGIHNTLIQRTHYGWKQYLASKQQLEFIWKQMFEVKTKANDLFCHMSPFDLYSIKFTCGPNPDICLQFDFRKIAGEYSESTSVVINEENIEERASLMLSQYGRLASVFPHNIALIPLGDDFRFNYDTEWDQQYKNYKLLFDHINNNKVKYNNSHIKFGTLNDFFDEVHHTMKKMNKKYPTLVGDFMPYADIYADSKPNYWTGYYTTRPYWKALSRELQHWLRSAEILYSLARNIIRQNGNIRMCERLDKDYMFLTTARANLALFQHHDAITGTSKEAVMEDYGKKLNRGIIESMGIISHSVQFLLLKDHSIKPTDMNAAHPMTAYLFPDIQRTSWDALSRKVSLSIPPVDGRKIVIFNSMGQPRIEPIRVYVKHPTIRLIDAKNGNELEIQINPVFNTTAAISTNTYEVEFMTSLAPLSLTTYILERRHSKDLAPKKSKISIFLNDANDDEQQWDLNDKHSNNQVFTFDNPYDNDFELETPYIKAKFDRHTGLLTSIYNKKLDITQQTHIVFMAYKSADFYSGAYLFKPSQFDTMQNITERFPIMRLISGQISSQLTVIYPNFIEVQFKVYHSEAPIGSGLQIQCTFDIGKRSDLNDWELIMRIHTDIETSDDKDGRRNFYVDSNGFQMIQRKYNEDLGVEANYYPMTTAMYIEDKKSRVTLLSSHSHGVSSPVDGLLEVMLERRIRYDDNRGLGEGIQDNKLTVSTFWVTVEGMAEDNGERNEKTVVPNLSHLLNSLSSTLLYPPVLLASDGNEDRPLHSTLSFIDSPLECDLFLVNLRTLPKTNDFNLPSLSSLLILHNRGNSCRVKQHISPSSLVCYKPKTKASKLLHINVQSINECSITAINSYEHFNDLSAINVPQMEINAYNITFVK